jgi:uncharacterized protein with NAD-binding domain and iron-sulfur cluster
VRIKAVTKENNEVTLVTEDQTATTMREQAKLAKSNIDKDYLLLAEALFEIKHKEYYRKWGIDTFATYCDQELDIKNAKAVNLTRIWDAIKSLALPREELIKIGYTKALMIVSKIESGEGSSTELIELAKGKSVQQLQEILSNRKYTNRVDKVGAADIVIKYAAESGHNGLISQAITYAKKYFNTEDASEAFGLLVNEWMMEHEVYTKSLDDIIRNLRVQYNADIVVVGTLESDMDDLYVDDDMEEVEAGVI